MSKEKQIEETIKIADEMASSVCRYHDLHSNGYSCLTCWRRTTNCNIHPILFRLAELNYRKQSGGEWKQTIEPLGAHDVDCVECSVCGESWVLDEDFDYDVVKDFWNFCPNCGAKMKGGAK